jgi:hypothetical protein
MGTKWRILLKYYEIDKKNATSIVKALCDLHNFILKHEGPDSNYSSSQTEQISSRPVQHRFSTHAQTARETFINYFNSVGSVQWQNDYTLPENILQRHNTSLLEQLYNC